MSKKELGQFYTTNYSYILQDLDIFNDSSKIIEPFTGNGDLLYYISEQTKKPISQVQQEVECYDIDPKHPFIKRRDSLLDPPDYTNKIVLTNPPYLARNQSRDKRSFDKYNTNDLYKCLIKQLIDTPAKKGALIIPLNFWSSVRSSDIDLRREFLSVYQVFKINIFEEQVFDDTTYTVCSFNFSKRQPHIKESSIHAMIFPSNISIREVLTEDNNYMFGGEIYNLKGDYYDITRLTQEMTPNTRILAKCIDDNSTKRIGLSLVEEQDLYIDSTPNKSARTYASLVIYPPINLDIQGRVVREFNSLLTKYREKYHSLFLPNYRESSDIARKRITFDLVYALVGYIIEKIENE